MDQYKELSDQTRQRLDTSPHLKHNGRNPKDINSKSLCKIVGLISIIILGFTGGYLAAGYGTDDREVWWLKSHIEIIQDQLQGLKLHLNEYNKTHGQYPTNDQGLAALDNFDARFEVAFYRDKSEPKSDSIDIYRGLDRYWWKSSKDVIRQYRQENGRVPQSTEEFSYTRLGMDLWRYEDDDNFEQVQAELGISKRNDLYLLSPAGVLSPWLVPYVYENRKGFDKADFADSLANRDRKRHYSIRVDEDVYVYSVGGQLWAKKLDAAWWDYNLPRFLGLALILAAGAVLVYIIRSYKEAIVLGIVAIAGSIAGGVGLHSTSFATCYLMVHMFYRRDPKVVTLQKELLNKYRQKGVINDNTLEKAISALDHGPEVPSKNKSGSRTR